MPDCFQSSPRICKVFLKIVLERSSRQHALHEENVTHTEVSALSLCQMPSLFTWATSEAIQKRQPAPAWERKCCFKWRWFTWSGGCPQRKAREMANDTHKGRKCPPPTTWNSCTRRHPSLERRKRKSAKLQSWPAIWGSRHSRESRRKKEAGP